MMRNLGQITTRLMQFAEHQAEAHADVDAFHAPSECHGIVSRGFGRRAQELVEELESSTGYSAEELLAELKARCSGRWLHFHDVCYPLDIVRARREDDERRANYARRMTQISQQSRLP